MTKLVRIENADLSDHKVAVEVWQKSFADGSPDVLIRTITLDNPTMMATEVIHGHQYLIIKEAQ